MIIAVVLTLAGVSVVSIRVIWFDGMFVLFDLWTAHGVVLDTKKYLPEQ